MRWTPLATLALLVACGTDGGDKNNPSTGDTIIPTGTVKTGGGDSGGGGGGQDPLNPVAVGFEFEGLLLDDGTFTDMPVDTSGSLVPPILKLTFADEDFFGLAADQQEGHYCEIAMAINDIVPNGAGNEPFNTSTGTLMAWSYELDFTKNITGLTECGPLVDPDGTWGPGAINLEAPFEGAHIGIGFAQMTDYLWDAFDGGHQAAIDAGTDGEFMAVYVAVNDKDGHWGGCDWTMTRVYEVDADDIPLEDPDNPGYLKPLDIAGNGTSPLPKGYMVNNAFWYQDFPLMDFTNLADAPTGQTNWLCE